MINKYENTLRQLILDVIGVDDDSNYQVSSDKLDNWKAKREEERKKKKGNLHENRIIYYSEFYELKDIIGKNWEKFKPILHDKKQFEAFFKVVYNLRNDIAHGREIIESQNYLLKGILGDLKNSITKFHNENKMKEDYFIQINKIHDNIGNVWIKNNIHEIHATLRAGDQYELYIDANDPKDRKIRYELKCSVPKLHLQNEMNRFCFEIPENFIGKNRSLIVAAYTLGSDYENIDNKRVHLTILPKKIDIQDNNYPPTQV